MGTLANIEDTDEMPRYSSGSALFEKIKTNNGKENT